MKLVINQDMNFKIFITLNILNICLFLMELTIVIRLISERVWSQDKG